MLLVLSITITMSMGSYFFIWLIIEASVFFTLPLMVMDSSRPNLNTESVIVYFIYQAVASILILCGVMQWMSNSPSPLLVTGILVKLGVAPFHVWVLPVLKGCGLSMFFLLLVAVKLPVYMLSDLWVEDFTPLLLLSISVGVLLAMNQSSLLSLVGASSIASTGVLLMCLKMETFNWYFTGYALSLGCILHGVSGAEGPTVSFGVLSLLGLPFLPMFLPKVYLLVFSFSSAPFVAFFLLGSFMVSAFYYVKFLPSGLMNMTSRSLGWLSGLLLISVIPMV